MKLNTLPLSEMVKIEQKLRYAVADIDNLHNNILKIITQDYINVLSSDELNDLCLLTIHQDDDSELQRKILNMLPTFSENKFDKLLHAKLVDRVQVNTGEKQIFYTQTNYFDIEWFNQLSERELDFKADKHGFDILKTLFESYCGISNYEKIDDKICHVTYSHYIMYEVDTRIDNIVLERISRKVELISSDDTLIEKDTLIQLSSNQPYGTFYHTFDTSLIPDGIEVSYIETKKFFKQYNYFTIISELHRDLKDDIRNDEIRKEIIKILESEKLL